MTSEIEKFRMDLVSVQEIKWEGNGSLESGNYTLFYGKGNAKHQLGIGFFVDRRIRQQLKVWTLSVTVFLILRKRVDGVILLF